MNKKGENVTVFFGAFCVLIMMAFGFWFYTDKQSWEQYKQDHQCVETGRKDQHTVYTGRAPMLVTRYEYQCDGETVWRR